MLLKLCQSSETLLANNAIATKTMNDLRKSAEHSVGRKRDRSAAFVCGAAGIHVVSAAILDFTRSHIAEKDENLKVLENQLNEGIDSTLEYNLLDNHIHFQFVPLQCQMKFCMAELDSCPASFG